MRYTITHVGAYCLAANDYTRLYTVTVKQIFNHKRTVEMVCSACVAAVKCRPYYMCSFLTLYDHGFYVVLR